jgi:hypothetical protein
MQHWASAAACLTRRWRPRAGLRNICPVTGQQLKGWVSVTAEDALRAEIEAWARSQQLDFAALANAKYKALPVAACRCGLVPPACACSPPLAAPHGADAPSDDWAQFCQGGRSRRSSSGGLSADLSCSHAEARSRGMRRSFSLPSIEVA